MHGTARDVDMWLEPAHPEIEWISELAQRFEAPKPSSGSSSVAG